MEKLLLKIKRFKNRKEIKAKKEELNAYIKLRDDVWDMYMVLVKFAKSYNNLEEADEIIRNMEQKIYDHGMVLEAITIHLDMDIKKLEN